MTIFVAGHIVGSLMLGPMRRRAQTLILSLWILPILKTSLIANEWALSMHGFGNAGRAEGAIGQSMDK
jgi:uncharacterized protein (DUF983 family)